MQKPFKLILDTFCEVHDLLQPYADGEFWDFENHETIPGAVYVISRKEFIKHHPRIRQEIERGLAHYIFSNPAEGSETIAGQLMQAIPIEDLAWAGKVLIIGGGDMDPSYKCLQYDSFLPKLYDYEENVQAAVRVDEIFSKTDKP